jgi:hypothetical protein
MNINEDYDSDKTVIHNYPNVELYTDKRNNNYLNIDFNGKGKYVALRRDTKLSKIIWKYMTASKEEEDFRSCVGTRFNVGDLVYDAINENVENKVVLKETAEYIWVVGESALENTKNREMKKKKKKKCTDTNTVVNIFEVYSSHFITYEDLEKVMI